MTRRPQLAALLVLLPLLAAAAPLCAATAAPTLAGAADLLAAAERAHAAAAAAVAGAPGWMGLRHSGHAAVARGLDEVRGALAAARAALAGRDAGLPRALRRGSVALAGLRVAWGRAGLAAPAATRRLRELAVAFDALRARCGPEGARAGRGGPLTPAERERLAAVQAARRAFAAALEPLGARAAARGDRRLAGELRRWIAQSERIAAAPPAVETLLEAVWLADHLRGEWTATTPYVPPPDRGDWLAAHAAVEDVLGESEVGYLAVADLGGAAAPLKVEPAAPEGGATPAGVELQVLASTPVVLFQPPELDVAWEEEEEESAEASAEASEEPVEGAQPAAEEESAEAAEPAEEGPITIEVVSESGEVLTVELPSPAPSPDPAPEPAPAPPPHPL
ncbi:MAG TPA: hypothetical protein VGC93_14890 [Thermoanaerobaculia bacterium]